MSMPRSIVVKPLEKSHISEIIDIHQSALNYTFNSQMGKEHLTVMYRYMLNNPDCCILAAFDDESPVGLVSGSIDMDRARLGILKKFEAANWMNMLLRTVKRPSLLVDWVNGVVIGKPVYYRNDVVSAILTTIAIKSEYQRMGIGEQLIHALEDYFRLQHVGAYRLDTLSSNTGARHFYKKLDFDELEQRADSIVLVKRIDTQ